MNEAISLVRAFYASRRTTLSPTDLRPIGPICTALEAFNPKRALLLSDQLLKRSPANPSALALKALAHCLTAAQPVPESVKNDVVKVVHAAKTANNGAALDDADVIMLLTWALRYIDQTEEALGLMAQAVQNNPDNEELAMDAFIQYLRVNNQKAAQQMSMKMAKQFKVDRYMWWSVLTTILLLRDLAHPQASLLLSLAERQLVAHYTTGRKEPATGYETANEFHLITRLLELRAQYAAAAATGAASATPTTSTLILPSLPASPDQPRTAARALLDHLASREADKRCAENLGFELWRREIELEYGSATPEGGEWKRLWDRLALGLKQNGDTNWHSMLYLIRAACAMAAATATSTASNAESAAARLPTEEGIALLQETRSLLRELATDSPKAKVERGYLLGVLELARELRERQWPEVDKLTELVGEYFERFGTKACCFDDLRPYIDIFSPEELQDLRVLLKPATQTELGDVRVTTKAINAHKLLRRYSPQSTAVEEHENALEFTKLYFDALPLGKDLPPTELQPADDFALLAGQAWVSAFEQSGTRHYLEHALALFEHVLLKSKYKYQIRILAINLLRLLGAPSLSVTHYRVFGVKNVQFDTLSHLMVARGSTFAITGPKEAGVFGETVSAMGWHSSGQTEAREMVVRAFTNEAYQKVEDFFEFKQHLQLSLQQSLITVEALRMSLLRGTMDVAGAELTACRLDQMVATAPGTFVDHRDFKTLPNYQSKASSPIWEQSHLGERLNDDWLRAMALTYSRLLRPASSPQVSMSAPTSFTADESWLFDFSTKARSALLSSLDEASEAEKALLDHFQDRAEKFSALADDEAALPWQVLQSATISLEAFLLLEIGIERRAEEMAHAKVPDQVKQAKRMRTLRNSVRDLGKPIGPKVTAYGKRIPKERTKVVASLFDLGRFEQFDENRLTNFATALIDSRRSATDALGAAYHRRTAK